MSSMRDFRIRIKSVNETMQITKAMNLIASSKLKKARKQMEDSIPFFEKLQKTIQDIITHSPNISSHKFFDKRADVNKKRIGYVIITADKGLCGSYNQNIIKHSEALLNEHQSNSEQYLFVIGHMGRDYFKKKHYIIDTEFLYTAQNPTYYGVRDIAETLVAMYEKHILDEVHVIYTQMTSVIRQEVKAVKLLPLETSEFKIDNSSKEKYNSYFEYTPSPQKVLDILIPNYIKGFLFGVMVQSYCSEQSARMTAMDAATKSADDMIKQLTLMYNRARQAAITQEISEIIGGANALM